VDTAPPGGVIAINGDDDRSIAFPEPWISPEGNRGSPEAPFVLHTGGCEGNLLKGTWCC